MGMLLSRQGVFTRQRDLLSKTREKVVLSCHAALSPLIQTGRRVKAALLKLDGRPGGPSLPTCCFRVRVGAAPLKSRLHRDVASLHIVLRTVEWRFARPLGVELRDGRGLGLRPDGSAFSRRPSAMARSTGAESGDSANWQAGGLPHAGRQCSLCVTTPFPSSSVKIRAIRGSNRDAPSPFSVGPGLR